MSHFSSIGFPVNDRQGLEALASLVAAKGRGVEVAGGGYIALAFKDGVQLWAQANAKRQVIGCHPHFAGKSVVRVRVGDLVPDPRSAFDGSVVATMVDEEAAGCPLRCDLPDYALAANGTTPGAALDLQIAAFAERLQYFANEDAFRSDATINSLSTKAFIPTGLLAPDGKPRQPQRSEAIFTGRIRETELRSNPLTGLPYRHILVESLGGSFDVVADPQIIQGAPPQSGGLVFGSFWLSARIKG